MQGAGEEEDGMGHGAGSCPAEGSKGKGKVRRSFPSRLGCCVLPEREIAEQGKDSALLCLSSRRALVRPRRYLESGRAQVSLTEGLTSTVCPSCPFLGSGVWHRASEVIVSGRHLVEDTLSK